MRWVVAIVGLLAVIVGAVVAVGEWAVRPAVERAIAADLTQTYALTSTPTVRLHGFPFVAVALTGRLDGATVTAEDLVVEGLTVRAARLEADDVRVDPAAVLERRATGTAAEVRATVTVSDAAFSDYLASLDVPLEVRIEGGGRAAAIGSVSVAGFTATGEAAGTLVVSDGIASFRADRIDLRAITLGEDGPGVVVAPEDVPPAVDALLRAAFAFDVEIPTVAGVAVTDVDLSTVGEVTLQADVTDYVLAGTAPPA